MTRTDSSPRRAGAAAAAVLLVACLMSPTAVPSEQTEAQFTDAQGAQSQVSAATMRPVGSLSCTILSAAPRVTWTVPSAGPAPRGYRVRVFNASGRQVADSGVLGSSARSWRAPAGLSIVARMRLQVHAVGQGQWESRAWIADVTRVTLVNVCTARSGPESS